MSSLVLTITETLRYRGAIGQWSWVLHRVTGLGVVLFLTLHVVDTSWAVFYPDLYEKAVAIYQSPLFTLGEFALVACVIYHAYNGVRIGMFDARPELWKHQEQAARAVLGITAVTLVPTFIIMFSHVLNHYSEPDVFILSLDQVLIGQLPFAVGMVVAAIVALLASSLAGLVIGSGGNKTRAANRKPQGSQIERFWWSYMRLSGLLIVPLVFGHLAMVHLLQGVFDLTAAGYPVVGVPINAAAAMVGPLGDGINATGTAVEFVGERWNFLLGGVAVWRLYDVALLALVTVHGFNGLRYVLTDYTAFNPILKRAAIYLCVIGAVVLLVTGGGALIYSVTPTAVEMAQASQCHLGKLEGDVCAPFEAVKATEATSSLDVNVVNAGS